MTKAKAVELLNELFDSYLTMEEACLDTIIKVDGKQFTLRDKLDEITDRKIALLTAIDALKAEPVKHGRWLHSDDKNWLMCPFCDTDVDISCGAPFLYVDNDEVSHINFCPNCGAKMDDDSHYDAQKEVKI